MLQITTKEQREQLEKMFPKTIKFVSLDGKNIRMQSELVPVDDMTRIVDFLRSSQQKQTTTLDMTIVAPEMREAVETWLAYKREKKQTYKPSGFGTFYKRLCKLSNNNPQVAMAIVEESMSNNYAGIFPLKNSNYGRPKTNTEKFYDTIQSANEFSQKLHERVGNQAEMGNGDSEPLW